MKYRRLVSLSLLFAAVLSLGGCAQQKPLATQASAPSVPVFSPVSSPTPSPAPLPTPTPTPAQLPTAFLDVLLGEKPYLLMETGEEQYLHQWMGGMEFPVVGDFTLIDLDGDGVMEAVYSLAEKNAPITYGYTVLDLQEDTVAGYQLWYRGLENLKEDGTHTVSSGMMEDNGVCRLDFLDGSKAYAPGSLPIGTYLAHSFTQVGEDGEYILRYELSGQEAAMEEYDAFLTQQQSKPDAEWLLYTEENVRSAFEQETVF